MLDGLFSGTDPMARSSPAASPEPNSRGVRSTVLPVAGSALLLIDVINDLNFDGSEALVAQAESMATPLAKLKRRASAAGVPVIYINDNFGQWRSDFRQTVAHCIAKGSPGRRVSERLRPTERDYFVLKPKHSGFFDTTLDTLLAALRIRRVILTGIAGNICVLFTANDAYMRELTLFAPEDCIVSNTPEENAYALQQIASVLKGNLTPSSRLVFGKRRRGRSPKATGPRRSRRHRAVAS
jgi:nicotinamidase-related amidase